MQHSQSAKQMLLKALRSTLQGLQQSEDLPPDDPALREIKSSILQRIARREAELSPDREPESEEEPAA